MGVPRDQERPNHRPGFLPCSSSCTHSRPLEKELFLALRKLRGLGVPGCQLTGVTCSLGARPRARWPRPQPWGLRAPPLLAEAEAEAGAGGSAGGGGGGWLRREAERAESGSCACAGRGDGAGPEGRRFREFRAAPGKAWWRMMRSEGSYLSRGPYESWT